MMTTYLVQAFDTQHAWLDTDPRGEGYSTEIEGAGAMLAFLGDQTVGVLHDWDNNTHTRKRIAYWVVSVGGISRWIYTTRWGRRCRVQIADYGPGCRAPKPVPLPRTREV